MVKASSIVWAPSKERIDAASITNFIEKISAQSGAPIASVLDLYEWSIRCPTEFWHTIWTEGDVIGDMGTVILDAPHGMLGARWFPEARLNFAENLLRSYPGQTSIIFRGEDKVRQSISSGDLAKRVASVRRFLIEAGVGEGDVVSALIPNMPIAVIGMLAASSLGAVWTSCSPDFGPSGIIDRFGQTNPKVLITSNGYFYKGAPFSLSDKISSVVAAIASIQHVLVEAYTEDPAPKLNVPITRVSELPDGEELTFNRLPFSHPLYIMYSSGTTGKPKCIVHGQGGTLLEHIKEHWLHTDIKPGDRVFYQTTCGWMMWNWLISALSQCATLVLYDGYPLLRDANVLFDLIDEERITVFGTNAKFLSSIEKLDVKPKKTHSLSSLETILSTGSPLLAESFDYVYRDIKDDVCLSSISGGTDIIGCFALGCPTLPVHRNELQMRSLGLNVQVWNDKGEPVVGERGELVCTAPFPSQPIGFWHDESGEKYRQAYFERFPGVWCHGDFVELTANQGMIFYGRSDAVLNPGGIRIGTAEIYRQVEKLPDIEESIVIGQEWEGDVRVVLFVKLRGEAVLDDTLKEKIRSVVRSNASPFHVPKKIISVPDIPRTRSGKIVELAVREVVHGRPVTNTEALLNPEALEHFREIADLRAT